MAITVTEEAMGRKGNILPLGGGDLERSFIAKTTNSGTTQYDIYFSGKIPSHGTSHPQLAMAILKEITFDPINKYLWRVVCRYTTRPEGQAERQRNLDNFPPWFLPAIITGSYGTSTEERGKDLNGKVFANSAGTPYSAQSVENVERTYTIRKSVPFMPSWFEGLANLHNADALVLVSPLGVVATLAAKAFVYRPVSFSEAKFAGPNGVFSHIDLTYQFSTTKPFERSLVDRGPHFKNNAGEPRPFNEGGEFFLDGFGQRLADGAPTVSNTFRYGVSAPMGGIIPTF